jgi:hypothetical protein
MLNQSNNDIVFENQVGSQWLPTSAGFQFPISAINRTRFRLVNPVNTTQQTFILRATNGRGSFQDLAINVQGTINCGPNSMVSNATGIWQCLPCPTGATCSLTAFMCDATFEINDAQNGCSKCIPGTFKRFSGNNKCMPCPANSNCTDTSYQCLPGFELSIDFTQCNPCGIGYYKPSIGNVKCLECPQTGECMGVGLTDFICRAGNYNSSDDCVVCQNGTFKAASGNNTCTDCPLNATCSDTGLSSFTCVAGYALNATLDGCSICEKGFFKQTPGNVPCIKCPNNAFCPEGSLNFTCNDGFFLAEGVRCDVIPGPRAPQKNVADMLMDNILYIGIGGGAFVLLVLVMCVICCMRKRRANDVTRGYTYQQSKLRPTSMGDPWWTQNN